MAHSGLRYLVLLVGVVALVLAAFSLPKRALSDTGFGAARVFLILLDIQIVLGIATLLTRPFYPALMGHIVMMVIAAGVAHAVHVAVKRAPRSTRPPGMQLAGIAAALALIVVGIISIGRPIV